MPGTWAITGIANIAYNIKRLIFHEKRRAMA
jgi:hypothetical protein